MPDMVQFAQSLVSGVGVGLIYGLVGIGFCVIYNASGIVNFAQGVFVMLGGMICHTLLTTIPGMPMLLAAVLTVPIVAAHRDRHRVPSGAAHVGPRRGAVRHHPGDACHSDRHRAHHHPDARRPAAHLLRIHRSAGRLSSAPSPSATSSSGSSAAAPSWWGCCGCSSRKPPPGRACAPALRTAKPQPSSAFLWAAC